MQTEAKRAERGLSNRQSPKPYRPPASRRIFALRALARAALRGKVATLPGTRIRGQAPSARLSKQMRDPVDRSHAGQVVKRGYQK